MAVDISMLRLEAESKVDIRGTVEKIRNQRANAIQGSNQYDFCYRAIIEYAVERNFLTTDGDISEILDTKPNSTSFLI